MLLRWVVASPATWQEGVTKGYTLIRMTTHEDGIALSGDAVRSSVVTLDSTLYPLSEAEWNNQFPDNDFAKVAKGTLYEADTSIQVVPGANPKLADAVNAQDSEEARFVFALFAAEQDFGVAKGMGLAYCDATIEAGATYIYRLAMNTSDVATAIRIASNSAMNLPPVDALVAEGADKAITLEWNIQDTEAYYSSYTVERSSDGTSFQPLNQLPFIFATDNEAAPVNAIYKDSLDQNKVTYYYRVCGRTPFGTKGPPSAVVQAAGIPPRITPFFIKIDSQAVGDNSVNLRWDSFNDSLTFRLSGFNVYRTASLDEDFELVSENRLSPTTRSYTDDNPLPVAYYMLEAVDDNDYRYNSIATLVQLPDTTPPAVPSGLTGRFVSSTRVQLTWQANTEADLKGYRLLAANAPDANFLQITAQPIADEQFVYEITGDFMVDSIYFKLLATDQRDNYSEESAYFALKRPDIIPPSKPVLQKVNPTPSGVELGWKFSSSADVIHHIIERKRANAPDWVAVLTIKKEMESEYAKNLTSESIVPTCYIDEATLERRGYEYRVLAVDDSGNRSSSEIITIRPFDNGQRGNIEGFAAKAACLPAGTISNQEGYAALSNILEDYQYGGVINEDSLTKLAIWQVISNDELEVLKTRDAYEVKVFLDKRKIEVWQENLIAQINLTWAYQENEQLKDFQIYRSAEGSPIMLYKTLPLAALTEYTFLDEDIRPDQRYYYQIIARHTDGGFSKKSKTLMVKVPKF
ncbi:MAG: hypothetical protein AAF960_29715 [Bacteroidota bacterium]